MSGYIELVPPRETKPTAVVPARGAPVHDAAIVGATVGLLILGIPVHLFLTIVAFGIFLLAMTFLIQVVLPLFILVAFIAFVGGGIHQYTRNRTTTQGREYLATRKAQGEPTGIKFAGLGALLPLVMFATPFVVVGALALLVGGGRH